MSHKRAMGDTTAPGRGWAAPTWVPEVHRRRLQGYTVCQGYYQNAARHFLPDDSEEARARHREYGDAALIVHQVVAALTGDDQSITVEGASDFDPSYEPVDLEPLPEDASEEELEARLVELDKAEQEAAEQEIARRAADRENLLQTWAQQERLVRKVIETETDAVKYGDGVYVMTWSNSKGRPRVRIYDPGTYFPVLTDTDEDYPSRVHLAWEIDDSEPGKRKVRRITFSLGLIQPATDEDGRPVLSEDGQIILREGDALDDEGRITRDYPWNDEPSPFTCYMTDATYTLEDGKQTVDDFADAKAEYAMNEDGDLMRNLDLEIDFVPVVHLPNTVAEKDHFGRSTLATVLQILDDLQHADTDLGAAAATSGTPAIALTKPLVAGETVTVGPGRVYVLGEGGRMDVLDSSNALDALLKYIEVLLKRLSVNTRLPEAVLGRVDPGQVPSGIALALSMSPLGTMVREMRLVREEKNPLLLKFAQRYMQRNGDIPPGPENILEAEIAYGSFLPSDRQATATLVRELLQAKAISRLTGVEMLIEAGFPIEDASEELRRIESEDFDGANALLEATGNEDEVSEYLGREVRPASTPEIDLPAPLPTPPPEPAPAPTPAI